MGCGFPLAAFVAINAMSRKKMKLIAGNCVYESYSILSETAHFLYETCQTLGIDLLFKCSYLKDNRTSADSYKGKGLAEFEDAIYRLKGEFTTHFPVLTDIHSADIPITNGLFDGIQVPALLCKQSSILEAAGNTQIPVYIKKGQFVSPYAMAEAKKKVEKFSPHEVTLIERGTFFGYSDLVVDFRSIVIMKEFGPVLFDVTHSVQKPGGATTGGAREFCLPLAKAAAAIGVDGFFMEVHPDPDNALSDAGSQLPFHTASEVLAALTSNTPIRYNVLNG